MTSASHERPLTVNPCREQCAWAGTPAIRGGVRVFACAGCGSQWVRSEAWTPVDADGSVPPAVAAERGTRGSR